jgi:drug/metabolite transporter (DMT)-like permease
MQTIFFGIGYWRLESVSHAYSHQAGRITVGQLAAVAAGSTLYAFSELSFGHLKLDIDIFVDWFGDPFILFALMWTGLISTALALYLETVALKVVSASELTLLMTTTSLWGASFAYVTIGETLSPIGFFGGIMILGGCILGNLAPDAQKVKTEIPSGTKSWEEQIP